MFKVTTFEAAGHPLEDGESRAIADLLRAGRVIDLGLTSPQGAEQVAGELERILNSHTRCPDLSYRQILVGQERWLLNWGTASSDHAVLLEPDHYPILTRLFRNVASISAHLRSPGENFLLSVIPSLRKMSTFPRYFHRESHLSLEQLKVEGESPSMYRMTCDMGLENSCEVLNVNLVPRRRLLNRNGRIKRKHAHLFQRQYIDVCKLSPEEFNSIQGQITEDMLPFPETRTDLRVGRSLIWLDDLFFHAPYLKSGRSISELEDYPRSIVIINEFRGNSYRDISWTASVSRLLDKIVPSPR